MAANHRKTTANTAGAARRVLFAALDAARLGRRRVRAVPSYAGISTNTSTGGMGRHGLPKGRRVDDIAHDAGGPPPTLQRRDVGPAFGGSAAILLVHLHGLTPHHFARFHLCSWLLYLVTMLFRLVRSRLRISLRLLHLESRIWIG